MKILILFLLFSILTPEVFAEDAPPPIGSYAEFRKNVESFCALKGPDAPANKASLWASWGSGTLVAFDKIDYPDISDPNPNEKYDVALQAIKADTGRLRTIGLLSSGPDYLEKASYVYKEVMSTIYACAVMNAKVRIIENTLKIPLMQSNIKTGFVTQLKRTREGLKKNGCLEVKDPSELSIKLTLLDNVTYQYCSYRHYLNYLDGASKNSMAEYLKTPAKGTTPAGTLLTSTDSAAGAIARSEGKISDEIAHTKEVFPQAMIAFTEFERTYASHVILQFILQDYIDLRTSLKQLLNPIGQVIYKASNAQSSK